MKRTLLVLFGTSIATVAWAQMPKIDDLMKGVDKLPKSAPVGSTVGAPDEKTNVAGIKEALAVGTERAVQSLSRTDGYFGNAAVKILMPSSLQKVADVARKVGYQKQVDEFILSMNRAAEAAAPLAARYFGDAIRDMTLQDVPGHPDERQRCGHRVPPAQDERQAGQGLEAGRVAKGRRSRGDARLQRNDGSIRERAADGQAVAGSDDYVTRKSLDGLFHMVGEEEKKIRTNPAARTTDLLKMVFGK